MKFLPTGKQFLTFGGIALATIFIVNNSPMLKNLVSGNGTATNNG